MVLGIDIGGTTTDIVGLENGLLAGFLSVRANDPVASASGALGKFLIKQKIQLSQISSIAVTGVGATFLDEFLFGIPLVRIDEFEAIGIGGTRLTNLQKAVVVSMGTGTALVKVDSGNIEHLGGTGIGGGTLLGLARHMLKMTDFETIVELAQNGSLTSVDLTIGDIAGKDIGFLPPDATASNFGKHGDKATTADLALGIINLVCQSIGMSAVFACRNSNIDTVILTGKLSKLPQTPYVFDRLQKLFRIKFLIPPNSEFSTAAGAAFSLL
jgi:type II pantothenate kinase